MNTFSLKPVNRAVAEGQLEADTQLPGVPFGRKHGVSVDDSEGDVDLKFDDWDPEDGLGGQEQQTGSG